jgi:hypothetical protein
MTQNADKLSLHPGTSLDMGAGCNAASALTISGVSFSDTEGVFFHNAPATFGNGALEVCTGVFTATALNNVVRENKTLTLNAVPAVPLGQIGIVDRNAFPFIQLYSFTAGGDAKIVYNIGGGSPQTVTLEFDDALDDHATQSADRASYAAGSDVHLTISDNWLNVDPTDEDSWTFGANSTNSSTVYQAFDENGASAGAGVAFASGSPNLQAGGNLTTINAGDLGVLLINPNPNNAPTAVINLQDNSDQVLNTLGGSAATAFVDQTGPINHLGAGSIPVTVVETESSSGIFRNTDESDKANIFVAIDAKRGTTATVDYNDSASSILVANYFGTLNMDATALGGEWNSGEELPVLLTDGDLNLNSKIDEDIDLSNPKFTIIPALKIGSPRTLASGTAQLYDTPALVAGGFSSVPAADLFSDVLRPKATVSQTLTGAAATGLILNATFTTPPGDFDPGTTNSKFLYLNFDIRSLQNVTNTAPFVVRATNATIESTGTLFTPLGSAAVVLVPSTTDYQQLVDVTAFATGAGPNVGGTDALHISFNFTLAAPRSLPANTYPIVVDIFSFGTSGDGNLASERFNNAIYRFELEETGDNTAQFEGTVEYIMLNQLNVNQTSTYLTGTDPITDQPEIIVGEDLTDEDSPRVNYRDVGADGVATQIADQQEAPTHSGVVSFDSSTYKVADTVTVTVEDQDLNVDVETIGVFTVVSQLTDAAYGMVGQSTYGTNSALQPFGRLLDITFDDKLWTNDPGADAALAPVVGECAPTGDTGLISAGFTLFETAAASGIFKGDFQVPPDYCDTDATIASTTGVDMEVNYVDFRDASGEIIEVGDGAGIRANTGSVSLDRTVYPVPWGITTDFPAASIATKAPKGASIFPIHVTGITAPIGGTETLGTGDVSVHVRVNDPDFDLSASGEDLITQPNTAVPPVKLTVSRGASQVILGFAGGAATSTGVITGVIDIVGTSLDVADDCVPVAPATACAHTGIAGSTNVPAGVDPDVTLFGPIKEIAPDAGIFETDITIRYFDGPADPNCPTTAGATLGRIEGLGGAGPTTSCIQQGDILTVEYTDPTDASGDPNTVTDSATFDLRNGVLQSDKSVYIIGADMILTIIEPDWDRDNDGAETYDLDVIEWDSDAATVTMGNLCTSGGLACGAVFDPEPSDMRETGDSTGIFQIVIEIPNSIPDGGDKLERGEEVVLEYTDWGPSGANFVGDEDEDVNLTIFTSNFGATVELDQKVYSWTDKIYMTIVAPDHNFDSNLVDEVGNSAEDPIKVSTRGNNLDSYKLVETGTDTGIFTGEVILTGFCHDADGSTLTGGTVGGTCPTGTDTKPVTGTSTGGTAIGPTDGFLQADDDDGITVSFEFSEDETVVGSALIRWNIGEVQWLEASYPATGTGVVRVVDPDMNLNPEAVDNFETDVWSDSDAGGIDLTVTETNEATGIFEGTVFFTVADESSGHRLRVAEGDTITAEYEDNTLPDPYTTADELDITATSIIGTIVPPLERAPASGIRVVDAFGNSLGEISVDQQVQITSDLANGQDRAQAFAYLVQVQDDNGVTVSLAWITGSLTAGQSFSPALSWIPDAPGTYTATAFVWESVDNPTALSPPVKTTVNVI